jgi:hypothetical protein
MPYSAVIQPWPLSLRKGGTEFSTLTAQITWVLPIFIINDASAWGWMLLIISTGRMALSGLFVRKISPSWLNKESG